MSSATITADHRARIARHIYSGEPLLRAAFMAFGEGGNNGNTAISADPMALTLASELIRKPLNSIIMEDAYSYTGVSSIEKSELADCVISEAAILDEGGNMIAFRNFAPKVKEADEEFEIKIKVNY